MTTILQACECEKCEGYGQESGASVKTECLVELRATLKATQAELERWRHGIQVEGDYVCPDSLELIELRAEVRRMREALKAAAIAVYPYTDKGNEAVRLMDAALAPGPPRAPGCTCQPAPIDPQYHQPACARYGCTCPYVLMDGMHYFECKKSSGRPG